MRLSLSLTNNMSLTRSSGAVAFDPASLFASGEKGFFYDFTDASSLTIATGISSVADKSPNGVNATQATAGNQPSSTGGYATFDGTDDFLATAAIDLSAVAQFTIFAGIRKSSDAARGSVVGNDPASSGGIKITAPNAASSTFAVVAHNGSGFSRSASGYSAPFSAVLTGVFDLSKGTNPLAASLRINTTTPALTDTGGAGAGSSGKNAAFYIGRRAGTTLPFNGRIYALLVIGRTCTANEITAVESWMNAKAGAY